MQIFSWNYNSQKHSPLEMVRWTFHVVLHTRSQNPQGLAVCILIMEDQFEAVLSALFTL